LGILGPGDTFGLGTLVEEPVKYIGTAQAIMGGEAFSWTRAQLCKLSITCARLSENALHIALNRLDMYANRHLGLISDTAEHRLADTLIRLGRQFGRIVPGGAQVDIKNEHLASLADVNFFTASRLLKAWERSGAVKKGRGTVTILHPEKLCFQ
jgi:CRP-like cAMP-binding protein